MTTKEILDRKNEIISCAETFRYSANKIMQQLSNDFNFTIGVGERVSREVFEHKRNNPGIFRNIWKYYFHGAEVRFENLETGQVIEIIYITNPEFGFLDGFFFHNYMLTTEEFKELGRFFKNAVQVWDAIDLLAEAGELFMDTYASVNRNVRAY